MMKKLLLLGGSRYVIPVIKAAHDVGIHVITCDYLPDNIGHQYADEYHNVSIVEKEEVLSLAQKLRIDGIMSFATDPGVVTAAYVAEQMGLPFQGSYKSVSILQDKGLFRKFLTEHGFNVPHAKFYFETELPLEDVDFFTWPVIVKPVDSAGSKGVTKVDSPQLLHEAMMKAKAYSRSGAIIVEDFLTFEGFHSSTDPFTVKGELQFITFSDQLFDEEADNPYTPAKIIWPTSMKKEKQRYLTDEIQRLMRLLKMGTGIYNIETCVGSDGKPYIMEVSPRGGGCKIAELQKCAYGVDLIENEVRSSIGLPVTGIRQAECDGYWCEMVVHANRGQSGKLVKIDIDEEVMKSYVKVVDISAKPGDMIQPFTGANMALGDMFLKFNSRNELDAIMSQSREWLKIHLV